MPITLTQEMKEKIDNDNKNQQIMNLFLPLILKYHNDNF